MSVVNKYTWNAPTIAQVDTFTPSGVSIGHTFIYTINGKSLTFVATTTSVSDATAGIVAMLVASDIPEFTELDYADNGTNWTATASSPGVPFTMTKSGTGTHTQAHTVANGSPNDAANVLNWSLLATPVNTNLVYFEDSDQDVLWNLDVLASIIPDSLTTRDNYSGNIGLPPYNPLGYREYRPQYFRVRPQLASINGTGQRCKFDFANAALTCLVGNTGDPIDDGIPATLILGTGIATLSVAKGSVGVAVYADEISTIGAVYLGVAGGNANDATLLLGSGVSSLIGLGQFSGTAILNGAGAITINKIAGSLIVNGTGTYNTLKNTGGDVTYNGIGTITTLTMVNSNINFTGDARQLTVTNATFTNAWPIDRVGRVVFTNGIIFSNFDPFLNPPNGFSLGSNVKFVVTHL